MPGKNIPPCQTFTAGLLFGMMLNGKGSSLKNRYTVVFKNDTDVLETKYNVPFGSGVEYTGDTPTKDGYIFIGWDPTPINIMEDLTCYACFQRIPVDTLLPFSVSDNVKAEALCEAYDPELSEWGRLSLAGQNPYIINSDGSVRMYTSGQYAYYPLNQSDTAFTVYMVSQSRTASEGDFRIMSATYSNSTNNAPCFFRRGSNIWTSAYGASQDADTGVSALNIHAMAIAVDRPGYGYYYLDGSLISTKSVNHSGSTLCFGGDASASVHDDINIYYAAVVLGAENSETIISNLQNIMDYYEIR